MNKNNNGIFLVCLIIAVAVTIIVMVFASKKDVEEYQQLQQSIEDSQVVTDAVSDSLNQVNDSIQMEYDNLDKGLDY